ncbi:unnamed protein product [Linum trigynum]|uniref:Uncharacterized protein n=1 Tax=Linum trigynum TaxID=586398 RepID=A0AAV2ETJ8_9ROSI
MDLEATLSNLVPRKSQRDLIPSPIRFSSSAPLSRFGAPDAALLHCAASYLPPSSRLPQKERRRRCRWPSMIDPSLPNANFPADDSGRAGDDDEKTTTMTEMTMMQKMMPETIPVHFTTFSADRQRYTERETTSW